MSARIEYLDGVRGVAILLVFIAHLIHGVYPHDRPFIQGLYFLEGGGFIGVQLFFVLSGYLITKNLVKEYQNTTKINLKKFYLKRIWRLYPVLILACLFYFLYGVLFLEKRLLPAVLGDIFQALTYTTNFGITSIPDIDYLSHTWSLCVEEQFYILWPLILILFVLNKNPLTPIVFLIALCFLLRHYFNSPGASYAVLRWDALMIGCLLSFDTIKKNKITLYFGIFSILYYALYLPKPISNIDYLISSLGCGAFLLHAGTYTFTILRSKVLIYFGQISYSLYIWHLLIMRINMPGYMSLIISMLIADASFRFFEKPVLTWARRRFILNTKALSFENVGDNPGKRGL